MNTHRPPVLRPLPIAASVFATIMLVTSSAAPDPGAMPASAPVRERFQFVILADRTGGHHDAVFEEAVAKTNLLAPEFVMCVGDLIEGVTDNAESVNRQWDEIEKIIARLKAPFHYVAGNHDWANPVMAGIWRKRHGPDYHAFVHEGALFVCLNSEAAGAGQLGDEQLAWLEKTLAANPKPRWTFLFLHKPLWAHGRRGNKSGWEKVETLLKGRSCTVFAGHVHDYTSWDRDGRHYYALATTGGIGPRRGPVFGEFDEIALVTMTKDGPVLANLTVDGILPPDVVTEPMAALREPLADGMPVQVTDLTGQDIRAGAKFRLTCSNTGDLALAVRLTPRPPMPFAASPADARGSIPPKSNRTFEFALAPGTAAGAKDAVSLERVVPVDWTLAYELANGRRMDHRGVTDVHFEKPADILDLPRVTVDGRLDDWPRLTESCEVSAQSQILPDLWKGPADCSYRFGAAFDGTNLCVAVDVTDNQIESAAGWNPWDQDGLLVVVDARPEKDRAAAAKDDRVMSFFLSPGDTPDKTNLYDAANCPKGFKAVCVRTRKGHATELAIPLEVLKERQGWQGGTIRLNVCIYDFDTETIRSGMEGYGTYMWWRPDWESLRTWPGSGTFTPTLKP